MTVMAVPERPALDLSRTHFDHRVRGLRVIGSWLTIAPYEPCMVLADPAKRLERCVPCVIPLSRAWIYTEEVGKPFEAAMICIGFAPALGLRPFVDADVNLILNVIRARLQDLLTMPPRPIGPRRVAGDIRIRFGDGRVEQKDIRDDV